MLKKQNFSVTSNIDLFDGGPILQADTSEIRTVKKSRLLTIDNTFFNQTSSSLYLISNTQQDFRCCCAHLNLIGKNKVQLSQETATLLLVKPGDCVRIIKLGS